MAAMWLPQAPLGGDVLEVVAIELVDFVEIFELDDYRDLAVVPQQADAFVSVLNLVWRGQASVFKKLQHPPFRPLLLIDCCHAGSMRQRCVTSQDPFCKFSVSCVPNV